MQSALRMLFPPQCMSCDALTETDFALCSSCWRDTPLIEGSVCDLCGVPLPGDTENHDVHCDSCMMMDRAWSKGRAVALYSGNARRLILALKHGDRPDIAAGMTQWLLRAAAPLIGANSVIVPIPIHWQRRFRRKYNQAAELAQPFACQVQLPYLPRALLRPKATKQHVAMDFKARFDNMHDAITAHPQRGAQIKGKDVLLLDDVMTSGATFQSATLACLGAGAASVTVLALARAAQAD